MKIKQYGYDDDRKWRMLLIYNIFRVLSALLFICAYWLVPQIKTDPVLYFSVTLGYLLVAFVLFIFWRYKLLHFQKQVLISGTIDILVINSLIYLIGFLKTGIGSLLYVYIAMLSILAPGQLAVFFAAVASCMVLLLSTLKFLSDPYLDISLFFSAGVYGAGFFATALTAWYLANWVKSNEELAARRGLELANLHKLNEYIVDRLKYGVIYIDSDQQVKVMNSAACQFLNIEEAEKGLTLKQVSPSLNEKYHSFISHQKGHGSDLVAQTTLNNIQVRFYASDHSTETPAVLIIINDLAEIAQQAQQMKLASLGFFSASIAHELRNPLGAISHACQLLNDDNESYDEDAKLKEVILNNCERMNHIIKNVLQISRSQKSHPESIDLNGFLSAFRKSFCSVNHCKMSVILPRKVPYLRFDKSQLEQVLVILCENAMEHGKDTETGEADITIKVETKSGRTKLIFCDTGQGVERGNQKNVFDPFFTTLISGNGMGLFLAKDLCEINQAQIELLECGVGACFVIQFNQKEEVTI